MNPDAILHAPLAWQFSEVDLGGPWGWTSFVSTHLVDLHDKLLDYEQDTLKVMKDQNRAKQIKKEHLCLEAQARLRDRERDDSELWELRLGHKKWRVWGSIRGSSFFILWWDPDHTVCTAMPRGVRR